MTRANVNFAVETATVHYEESKTSPESFVAAVEKLGFGAVLRQEAASKLELEITGMTCANCSARIERLLAKAPGVRPPL